MLTLVFRPSQFPPYKWWEACPKTLVALDILILISWINALFKYALLQIYLVGLSYLIGLLSIITFEFWACYSPGIGWNKLSLLEANCRTKWMSYRSKPIDCMRETGQLYQNSQRNSYPIDIHVESLPWSFSSIWNSTKQKLFTSAFILLISINLRKLLRNIILRELEDVEGVTDSQKLPALYDDLQKCIWWKIISHVNYSL